MADILIVEDEESISELMKRNLELVGHSCSQVYDGNAAREAVGRKTYDLILLDVMLPGISGFELVKELTDTAVIFVTARESLTDRLRGLTSGAEDYIVKPFDMLELIARAGIVLKRARKEETRVTLRGVTIDLEARCVLRGETVVDMTPMEFKLLEVLVKNRNIALSRERFLELVWGYDYEGDTRTVDVHIQRLRKKLGWEECIRTVYKMGYRLEV